VVARVAALLSDLRDQGLAILLVEQDLRTAFAFAVADEIAVMGKGEITHRSPTLEFRRNAPWRPACSGSRWLVFCV
jgi:branched-chain amino acid transport system ATP-binding protein